MMQRSFFGTNIVLPLKSCTTNSVIPVIQRTKLCQTKSNKTNIIINKEVIVKPFEKFYLELLMSISLKERKFLFKKKKFNELINKYADDTFPSMKTFRLKEKLKLKYNNQLIFHPLSFKSQE